ncbi:hypothetical protein SAMD00019534_081410 [Acytostelium subglobosum LB1]|uniref:hypothetical protein n=1 Tax=Acytostelium subglobosum LB1 TaxID=1410327 RepID=UPI000644BA7E|nr:hypothetical protein SAMD00019534_081410 [Acytostelium subglobosum LB1]GAM24966.1 hypothetical protein SAMD00019534_081410 [Acytostelium subglobosum LB1]|eukprot:XP_012752055.1 hypothetical protein SAMD00019534_081410 [Acytostelium subglobosum LB1]
MPDSLCINGTLPNTPDGWNDLLVPMDTMGILLGVVLILGGVASTLPQWYNILKSRSSAGLSYLWLFLGNVNQYSAAINIFMLKYPQVDACSVVGFAKCAPSLLSMFQLFVLWIFTFPIFVFYIIFTPQDLRRIEDANGDVVGSRREFKLGKTFFGLLILFIFVIALTTLILLAKDGPCDHTSYIFGYTMGLVSTIATFIQWSPQIYKTFKAKTVGTFSILMLLIQWPGNLLTIYFLIFVSHESVSTWLSYVSAAIQIAVLLVLLIYYHFKNKRAKADYMVINDAVVNMDGDDISPSSQSPPLGSKLASNDEYQPLLIDE